MVKLVTCILSRAIRDSSTSCSISIIEDMMDSLVMIDILVMMDIFDMLDILDMLDIFDMLVLLSRPKVDENFSGITPPKY